MRTSWRRRTGNSAVLVTLDKDFGELAIRRSLPHCGIVRLVSISATRQGAVCQLVLAQYGDELTQGAIVTVEAGRVRIRPPVTERRKANGRVTGEVEGGFKGSGADGVKRMRWMALLSTPVVEQRGHETRRWRALETSILVGAGSGAWHPGPRERSCGRRPNNAWMGNPNFRAWPEWIYYVEVCGFTFAFFSLEMIQEYLDFYSRKILPSSRLYGASQFSHGAAASIGDGQTRFERLPL